MHRQGINSYVATYVLSSSVTKKSLINCGNYHHETLLLETPMYYGNWDLEEPQEQSVLIKAQGTCLFTNI
jgi:hypothetical protein